MSTVLIVEDDADILFTVEYMLRKQGHHCLTDTTGEFVHDIITRHRPNIILLDSWLPHKNGLEICREIKLYATIPIIIFSAANFLPQHICSCGADGYLEKPFDQASLLDTINHFTQRQHK